MINPFFTRILLRLTVAYLIFELCVSTAVKFDPGSEFRFDYEGISEIENLGRFSARAKVRTAYIYLSITFVFE